MPVSADHEFRKWLLQPSQFKFELIDKYSEGNALEIGCGAGFYSKYLADKGLYVVSLDIEKRFSPDGLNFLVASAEYLPFRDKTFDTIILFDVLEHCENDKKAMDEIRRLCRKRIIMSVPNKDDSSLIEYNLTYLHHKDKTHKREYSEEEIKNLFRKHGFRTVYLSFQGEVSSQIFAEFVKFKRIRFIFKGIIYAMKLAGLLRMPMADIYLAGEINTR